MQDIYGNVIVVAYGCQVARKSWNFSLLSHVSVCLLSPSAALHQHVGFRARCGREGLGRHGGELIVAQGPVGVNGRGQ